MSLVVISYLICWMPITLNFIMVAFTQNRRFFHDFNEKFGFVFHTLTLIATHLNTGNNCLSIIAQYLTSNYTAIDPLIYAYRIKEVREGIKRLFHCQNQTQVVARQTRNSSSTIVSVL